MLIFSHWSFIHICLLNVSTKSYSFSISQHIQSSIQKNAHSKNYFIFSCCNWTLEPMLMNLHQMQLVVKQGGLAHFVWLKSQFKSHYRRMSDKHRSKESSRLPELWLSLCSVTSISCLIKLLCWRLVQCLGECCITGLWKLGSLQKCTLSHDRRGGGEERGVGMDEGRGGAAGLDEQSRL